MNETSLKSTILTHFHSRKGNVFSLSTVRSYQFLHGRVMFFAGKWAPLHLLFSSLREVVHNDTNLRHFTPFKFIDNVLFLRPSSIIFSGKVTTMSLRKFISKMNTKMLKKPVWSTVFNLLKAFYLEIIDFCPQIRHDH